MRFHENIRLWRVLTVVWLAFLTVGVIYEETIRSSLSIPESVNTSHLRNHQICIISVEVAGFSHESDIGTAVTNLALVLAAGGLDVTLIWAGSQSDSFASRKSWNDLQRWYGEEKVRLIPLPMDITQPERDGVDMLRSYAAYQWVLNHSSCDVVHFHDWKGLGYYTSLAVQERLHPQLDHLTVVITLYSSELWRMIGKKQLPDSLHALQVDMYERSSIEHADVVLSPTRFLMKWTKEHRYKLPNTAIVSLPAINPHEAHGSRQESSIRFSQKSLAVRPQEFVFFGSLDRQEEFFMFIAAAQQLQDEQKTLNRTVHISVAGIRSRYPIALMVRQELPHLVDMGWTILIDQFVDDAVLYLAKRNAVAVIPSLHDNLPYAVISCLIADLPFITFDVNGIAELIFEADWESSLAAPTLSSLRAQMSHALRKGLHVPRLAWSKKDVNRRVVEWNQMASTSRPVRSTSQPLVSVIISTWNRSDHLMEALRSLVHQTYCCVEVIVVDDGNEDTKVLAYLERVEAFLLRSGWKLLHTQNRFLGAARNLGAQRSQGDLLLFMDDDNVAMPHEIETFVTVMVNSRVDVLTCFVHYFDGSEPLRHNGFWMPEGAAVSLGAFYNAFGDANFMIRRYAFQAMKGFTTDRLSFSDWELLANAVLSGYTVQVIPQALFWKRVSIDSITRSGSYFDDYMGAMRAYEKHLPHQLLNSLLLANAGLSGDRIETDSVEDFRPMQGYKGWLYGYSYDNSTFIPFPVATVVNETSAAVHQFSDIEVGAWCLLRSEGMHPCLRGAMPVAIIRRWQSNVYGPFQVRGSALITERQSDGILFAIVHMNETIFHRRLFAGNPSLDFNLEVQISIGDNLDFMVHPLQEESFDYVLMRGIIKSLDSPEPLSPPVVARPQ